MQQSFSSGMNPRCSKTLHLKGFTCRKKLNLNVCNRCMDGNLVHVDVHMYKYQYNAPFLKMWFIQEEKQECVRTEIALCSIFVHEMSRRGRDWTFNSTSWTSSHRKTKAQHFGINASLLFWREFPPWLQNRYNSEVCLLDRRLQQAAC